MADSIKLIDAEKGTFEGLAIPYGGPLHGKDLDGDSFTSETDFHLDWFPQGRPILYHHGLDYMLKAKPIAKELKVTPTERGMWLSGQFDMSHEYITEVMTLLRDEALGFSSGSMPHLVMRDPGGYIRSWPWIETSMTPVPSNPYGLITMKSHDLETLMETKGATLGKMLSARRKKKGLTYAQMADETGMSSDSLQSIIRGSTRKPRMAALEALGDVLDISVEKMLGALEADGIEYEESTSKADEDAAAAQAVAEAEAAAKLGASAGGESQDPPPQERSDDTLKFARIREELLL